MTPDELIRARKSDWERLTALTQTIRKSSLKRLSENELTELGQLYRLCTSDLAIAQRDFPQHDLARYLNHLVGGAHSFVYSNEPLVLRKIKDFYLLDYPRLYWSMRGYIAFGALLFLLPALIAFFVLWLRPELADYLLDASLIYRIENGTQWWKDLNEANQVGAAAIMTNNIRVSILAFAGGMLFGLLTVWITLYNGALIGGVFGLLQANGHAQPLAEFVIGHGVLEINEIIMSAGAGLLMGHAMLQPGLLTRGNALKQAARKALKFLLGSLPLLVIAGVIEGFVSPSDTIPWAVKIAVGIGSGLLFFAYLLVFGLRSARQRR
jgi:uncharacterized membrane protein SpoIIM required for sporulation